MASVAPLSSLVTLTKNLSLEQILALGFERLPANPEFYRALLQRIDPKIPAGYFERQGWNLFEGQVMVIQTRKSLPTLLKYGNTYLAFYWNNWKDGRYLVINSSVSFETPYTSIYLLETLEQVYSYFLTLMKDQEIKNMSLVEDITGPAVILDEAVEVAYDAALVVKNRDKSVELKDGRVLSVPELVLEGLRKGNLARSNGGLPILPLPGLAGTYDLALGFDGEKVFVIGSSQVGSYNPKPFMQEYSKEDLWRVMTCLSLNMDSIQWMDLVPYEETQEYYENLLEETFGDRRGEEEIDWK
jgi:hypothetical protein